MPNWCDTCIHITSDDDKKTEELFGLIEKWKSNNHKENGFGLSWLGNIVGNSGIAEWNEEKGGFYTKDGTIVACRGTLNHADFYGGEISIFEDTAWEPMLRMWKMICDKYLPNASITYSAIEPGCGLYLSNDDYLVGSFNIDVMDWNNEHPEFVNMTFEAATVETAINFCQRAMLTNETDLDKLLKKAENFDWFSINEWKYCDVEDL